MDIKIKPKFMKEKEEKGFEQRKVISQLIKHRDRVPCHTPPYNLHDTR